MKTIAIDKLIAKIEQICKAEGLQIEDVWVRFCMKDSSDIVVFYYEPRGEVNNFSVQIIDEFNLPIIEADVKLKIAKIQKKETDCVEIIIKTQ